MTTKSKRLCHVGSEHPFAVERSTVNTLLHARTAKTSSDQTTQTSDGGSSNCVESDGRANVNGMAGTAEHLKAYKTDLRLTLLTLIAVGLVTVLIWSIVKTGDNYVKHHSRIVYLENETKLLEKTTDALIEGLFTQSVSTTTTTTTMNGKTARMQTGTSTPKSIHAFKILQTTETVYKNYSFLALRVEVPRNGLSVSENWCRDYQYLCEQFSRRPTGCGVSYISFPHAKCAEVYNSDMFIDDVLGCSPSPGVAMAANAAFPNLSTPARASYNSFGFIFCDELRCNNTIRMSERSLHAMKGFWKSNETIMYTLCR